MELLGFEALKGALRQAPSRRLPRLRLLQAAEGHRIGDKHKKAVQVIARHG